ncbi:hypothetical protein ACWGH8_24520 [Nonomuraea muscovyensis]|uniref:Uncharacterized protein n=1 Tax=Nonomuraea muscovyensis TaxID=1124761 RepID=A0A7X0F279_9ACTN|nr:hypothetical protein [Nonomuraea muscovyensis]MBB6349836.1 hypothetical protein [Nonomuraea muscovyensis]
MLVISLQAILEEATAEARFNVGQVKDLSHLLRPDNLRKLREYSSVCCFLAFHPAGDPPIVEYVRSGTMADDSGPNVLVLFVLDRPAPIAVPVGTGAFGHWAEIGVGVDPAHRMVRTLFSGSRVPPLPGLVVFRDLAEDTDGVYLPLGHLESEREVRLHLREVFAEMDHLAATGRPAKLLDDLGVQWTRRGLAYERTDRRPMREWLIEGFRTARENYGDLVGTIGLFG